MRTIGRGQAAPGACNKVAAVTTTVSLGAAIETNHNVSRKLQDESETSWQVNESLEFTLIGNPRGRSAACMGMGSMEWDAKHATCYTKWHTSDQDNVDLQLSPSPTTLTHVVRPRRRRTFTSRDYWPASYRGMMVKVRFPIFLLFFTRLTQ